MQSELGGKRRLSRFIVSLCILFVLPLVAEAVARLWLDPAPGRALLRWIPSEDDCLKRSKLVGIELRPNCEGRSARRDRTRFHTNELGLRDNGIRDDGAVRILSIGDSCTFGWQVPQKRAYPQVLQRLLDRRFGPHRFRVINAGVPGHTSYQGLLYLRERGLSLDPKIVIFGFVFNDFTRAGDVEQALLRNRQLMPLLELDDFLLHRSSFWRWVQMNRMQINRTMASNLEVRVPIGKYQRNLRQIIDLVRGHGARPLMLLFATEGPSGKPYAGAATEVAEELEVPTIAYSGPLIDTVHPTKRGYKLLAAEILERLVTEGYLTLQE